MREPSAVGLGVASVAGPAALLLTTAVGPTLALAALATAVTVSGASVFLRSGRARVTPVGVFALSGAVFIGIASLATAADERFTVTLAFLQFVALATSSWYLAMAGAVALDGTRSQPRAPANHRPPVPIAVLAWGLVLLATGFVLTLADLRGGRLDTVLGYAGVLLVAAYLLRHSHPSAAGRPLHLAVIAGSVAMWGAISFSGGGRLNVATLGLALLSLAVVFARWKWAKLLVIVALVPAIVVAGLVRAQRHGGSTTVDSIVADQTGLGSLISPVHTMAAIQSDLRDGALEPSMGDTFLASVLTPVPRSALPGKPKGFGAVLTEHFFPELVAADHSMAALAQGEWLWNFGAGGLVGFTLGSACLLHLLERWQRRAIAGARGTAGAIGVVTAVVAMAGVADYVWTGTSIYISRAGFRMIVLFGLLVVVRVGAAVLPRTASRAAHG